MSTSFLSPLCRPSSFGSALPVSTPDSTQPLTSVFELIQRARDEGVVLTVSGDRLEADAIPVPALMADLSAHETLIVEMLKAAEEYPRRKAWSVALFDYRFFLIGPRMSRTQAQALVRWRWPEAEIVD